MNASFGLVIDNKIIYIPFIDDDADIYILVVAVICSYGVTCGSWGLSSGLGYHIL